jgi:hypothetical protein
MAKRQKQTPKPHVRICTIVDAGRARRVIDAIGMISCFHPQYDHSSHDVYLSATVDDGVLSDLKSMALLAQSIDERTYVKQEYGLFDSTGELVEKLDADSDLELYQNALRIANEDAHVQEL